ncbi:MAG: conjugal transfer protein [Thermoleophilaceae bacterium]
MGQEIGRRVRRLGSGAGRTGSSRSVLRGVGRGVLWAAVVLVLARGVGAIVAGPAADGVRGDARSDVAGFPDAEARAFAVRFVRAYLDLPAGGGEAHGRAVASFLADGLSDRAAIIVPRRSPGARVAWATVAREASLGDSRALLTVAALMADGRTRYVTVPVARDDRGGLAVYGLPSFAAPPPRGALSAPAPASLSGPAAVAIGDLVERFLREYVAGADRAELAYLLLPGAELASLPPGLRIVGVDALEQAASTTSRRRSVLASVRVRESSTGAVYPLGYRLDLARRDRWYVAAVAGGPGA